MIDSTRFDARPKEVQYDRLESLYFLGSYRRRLPVSMVRMMENAHDWEHLPFVHAGTFSDIKLIENGPWGWRAEVGSTKSNGKDRTLLELLVDEPNNYWATTVVQGEGEGVEIHTQATANPDQGITVDVRFYAPFKPGWFKRTLGLRVLRSQYSRLYDEDEQLMLDRQRALNAAAAEADPKKADQTLVRVGEIALLDTTKIHSITHGRSKFCVTKLSGEWIAYSALCPHQLGSLVDAPLSEDGVVTCPWHGYRFNVLSGQNIDNKCGPLKPAPAVVEQCGVLFLQI